MDLKYKVDNWYSFKEGMQKLKVSEKVLLEMIKSNMLEVIDIPSGKVRRYINPSSIELLFSKLDESVSVVNIENEKAIDIMKAYMTIKNIEKKLTFTSFIEMILNGYITPCAKNNNNLGFSKYYFSKGALKIYLKNKLDESFKESRSKEEAIKLLNISIVSFEQFVNKGIIKVEKLTNSVQGVRINLSEIENFRTKYIDLKQIKKQYQFTFNPSVSNFMSKGITPVSGPPIDGGRKYLFLKSDIDHCLLKYKLIE
ncbi:hypothetical protein [Robertmurraya massiliosenegalensis]|uniref:hypothetical protein n=1 Tax=Robertmurraya massiliosenegalensis TaxID=1287657 RepID=UPI000309D86B|nr:hypothetical protein [Robertmurraya massiliosenegalensis]